MGNDFTPFFAHLVQGQRLSKPVALLITAVLLLLCALLLRTLLYFLFRASGQKQYTASWQVRENIALVVLFVLGSAVGYWGFGQIVSALLSGGCFAFAGSGTVLQALTANEKNHNARTID